MGFYVILNQRLERIGTLDIEHPGATPFYGDLITKQLADDASTYDISSVKDNLNISNSDLNANNKNWNHVLEGITVPYGYPDTDKIAQGNHIAYQDPDNGRYYVFRLTNIADIVDSAGTHWKQANGINLAIWKLGKTIPNKHDVKNANSETAFNELLQNTGWYMRQGADLVGGSYDISFDGTSSAQSQLQSFCQMYGAEVDAYVVFNESWHIIMKRIEVVKSLGTDEGKRVEYARNITNISRNIIDDNLYTKLFVYGANGNTCANASNDNKPFVFDEVANATYNPPLDNAGETYLEGAITSSVLTDPYALYDWGARQLRIFNHPRANYTVTIDRDFDAHLGDTIRVLDLEMKPELTVQARVIKKQMSFSDPTQNQIILGEYSTVNVIQPDFIQNMISSVENVVAKLMDQLRKSPNALSAVIDKPNGTSWEDSSEASKKFIAHVSVLGQDISSSISPEGYIWELLDTSGNSVPGFYGEYNNPDNPTGQIIELNNHEVGELRLSIDTDKIYSIPEITFNDNNSSQLFTIDKWVDHWGDEHDGQLDYVQYNDKDECYYVMQPYKGGQDKSKFYAQGMDSIISRFDSKGQYLDSMILVASNPNGSFGLEYGIDDKTWIWTNVYFEDELPMTYLAKVQYVPNTVIPPKQPWYKLFRTYKDKFLGVNLDLSSKHVIVNRSDANRTTEIFELKDSFTLSYSPIVIRKTEYGFTPKQKIFESSNMTSDQTYQSSCLKFPYYFFVTGDLNMSDQRLIWCINVLTKTLVFKKQISISMFNIGNYDHFAPKTINWTMVDNDAYFLLSAVYDTDNPKYVDTDLEGRIVKKHLISSLWKVEYLERAKLGVLRPDDNFNIG